MNMINVLRKSQFINPLNATGANIHQVPMFTDDYGSERVNRHARDLVLDPVLSLNRGFLIESTNA